MLTGSMRRCLSGARQGFIWRPAHARLVWDHLVHRKRNQDAGLTEHDHLVAAAEWLEGAQDAARDGGIMGRYRLESGWTSSYPETTGYTIPTLLSLARELGAERFADRARRCVEFLLRLQLPDGGFPAGEIRENATSPSVFNTAQIISGLVAWHSATGEGRALDAACRAADWLIAVQEADGSWRRYVYNDIPTTYSAHASCWLAELGRHINRAGYLHAARRHLDWVLAHHDSRSGWFDRSGFSADEHQGRRAVTHTIAYTLWGVLMTSEILGHSDGIAAVKKAAAGVARRLELSGWLPGVLDSDWRPKAEYACLSGNAQMALVWFRLYALEGDVRMLNAALKAVDLVKMAQPMFNPSRAIRGGIPGSDPVWGDYLCMALPNWGAKFFIDSLLAKKSALGGLSGRQRGQWRIPADVPQRLPAVAGRRPAVPLRVVLYSVADSPKVSQIVRAWSEWKFKPTAVVFERRPQPGLLVRIRSKVRQDGFAKLLTRLLARARGDGGPDSNAGAGPPLPDAVSFCRREGIPIVEVNRLDSPESVAAVRSLRPDLAIHAGAGILRAPLLSVPRLGTLNAHMGILPFYRGVTVAEWTWFQGDPVGCSVHLIDQGIDTGDILCVKVVDMERVATIRELREAVDGAQVALLGEMVHFILTTGQLPPGRPQASNEGRQFFRMHPDLAAVCESEMRTRVRWMRSSVLSAAERSSSDVAHGPGVVAATRDECTASIPSPKAGGKTRWTRMLEK